MTEIIIPVAVVVITLLLIAAILQGVALSKHKREIERLHRELMRKTGSGVGIAERERDGQRRIEHLTRRMTGTELRRQQQEHIAEAAARSAPMTGREFGQLMRLKEMQEQGIGHAPQAQGDSGVSGLALGIVAGQMLTGAAPRHDASMCPPQAPSVESPSPSPSCEAPSPSSSYDSSPSSSSDSGSSFSSGGTD